MATHPQPDSTSLIAEFLELAGLKPALIAELAPRIAATGDWKQPLTIDHTTWPSIDSDYRLADNSPEFGSQLLRTHPTDDINEVVLTYLPTPQPFIEVAEPSVYWDSQTPIGVRLQEGSVLIDPSSATFSEQLFAALELISGRRHSRFVACPECGERNPPEHRMGDNICHGCAQKNHGVIF